MPELTKCDLYRSRRVENFPNGVMQELEPAPGLLEPDIYPKELVDGGVRAADVEISNIEGVEWVKSAGGTSLFDRAGVFTKVGWLSFEIPNHSLNRTYCSGLAFGLQKPSPNTSPLQ